jgi:uncharacterized protein
MKKLYIFSILLIILFCNKISSQTYSIFPKPIGYVNDFANLIDDNSEKIIIELCKNIKKNGLVEIGVCTIDSIPLVKEEYKNEMLYATDLFNNWCIGEKNKDNGLLIFISKKDRKAVISNGNFTQYVLTDSTSYRILDKTMIPYFKKGNYGLGIIEGIKVIEYEIDKNYKLMYPENHK